MSNVKLNHVDSAEIIAGLFPTSVSGLILSIEDYSVHLSDDELQFVANASSKRKSEFSTGRWCAKQLLKKHNITKTPVLSGEHREPLWPDTIVGSISHCKDLCGAVIAKNDVIQSIGFDLETQRILKHDIARVICTHSEKTWINEQTTLPYDNLVLLLFSLKESVYKCVFQHQQIKLGFKDVSLHPDLTNNTAQVTFGNNLIDNQIELKFYSTEAHIYTSAIYRTDNSHERE